MKTHVVLLSGGQDSTTCLFWSLEQLRSTSEEGRVVCLSLSYGQRHEVEIEAASKVVDCARKHYPEVEIVHESLSLGSSVLLSSSPLVSDAPLETYQDADSLPGGVEKTFVPGRNLLFLVVAANRAAHYSATTVITGVCQEDFGGYFDCRREFINAAETAISQAFVGLDSWCDIKTPLMFLTKKDSVLLARMLGEGCWEALAHSHTCYAGVHPPCGKCHACLLRSKGFEDAGYTDPILAGEGG